MVWGGGWLYGCLTEKSPPPPNVVGSYNRYVYLLSSSLQRRRALLLLALLRMVRTFLHSFCLSCSIVWPRSRCLRLHLSISLEGSTRRSRLLKSTGQRSTSAIHRENTAMGEREGEGIEGERKKKEFLF